MHHTLHLQDQDVLLRPLTEADIAPLQALAAEIEGELVYIPTPPTLAQFYQLAITAPEQQAFVIEVAGELAGTTRYLDMRPDHGSLEIGATWLQRHYYGSGINRRVKFLLLEHAFETLGMERVQLRADGRNQRSQRAIEKLGAVREGVLRRNQRTYSGYLRDTVVYSILGNEWPALRAKWND